MAFEFSVTTDGAQGRIKGEADHAGHAGKIPGRWFRSRLAVPRDGAAGGQGQRRKHEPLTFRKIVGLSSPRMLAATISHADWFFSADTGPMHLASAAGVATIAFFDQTNPAAFGPIKPRDTVLRIGGKSPQEVAQDCASIVAAAGRGAGATG